MLPFAFMSHLQQVQAKSLHPDFQLKRGEVQAYGDWLAGCDNRGTCTLLGFPQSEWAQTSAGDEVRPMAIEIRLAGSAGTRPEFELLPFSATLETGDAGLAARSYVLDLEFRQAYLSPPRGFSRQRLSDEEAAAAIERLLAGLPLQGISLAARKPAVRFALHGFARAWRAVQARRGDLLRAAAQEPRGELPDGSAMPAPLPLARLAARPVIVSGFVPLLTSNACARSASRNMQRFRFPGDADLWSYECAGAPGRTLLAMSKGPQLRAQPLDLPEPRLGKLAAGRAGLTTAGMAFDWDFGVLRHYDYRPDREDCGVMRAWGYTANGWHLLERREMPLCLGLGPEHWIATHHMPTAGSGPDD